MLSAAEQPRPKPEAAQLREFALRTVRPLALPFELLAHRRLRMLGKLQALLGSTSRVLCLCQPLDKRVHVHGRPSGLSRLSGPGVEPLVYGPLRYPPTLVYIARALKLSGLKHLPYTRLCDPQNACSLSGRVRVLVHAPTVPARKLSRKFARALMRRKPSREFARF